MRIKNETICFPGCKVYIGGLSEIGPKKKVNQDAIRIGYIIEQDIVYIIIADGLGSCIYSDKGAEKIVDIAEKWFREKLKNYFILTNSVSNIFMKKIIESWKAEYNQDEVYDYDTTIHFSLYYKGNIMIGGIGDGMALISYDDIVCKDFIDEKNMFSNITDSMCSMNISELMKNEIVDTKEYKRRAVVILSTDGISDDLIPDKKLTLPNYFYDILSNQGIEHLQNELKEWIEEWNTEENCDDKSLCYMIVEKEV